MNADDVTKVADKPSEEIASVVASQGSGELELNSKITLSCATSDAKIMYKLNDGEYLEYKEPITITVLPATLKTYAILNGESSKEITYTYHEVFTGTYNTYFGQLHAHTNLSDGAGSVESAFEYASKVKNLDFLAVTDHSNSFEGSIMKLQSMIQQIMKNGQLVKPQPKILLIKKLLIMILLAPDQLF